MIFAPKVRSFKEPDPVVINKFGGVDYSTEPTQIALNRAEEMINMQLDTTGNPERIYGYKKAFTTALAADKPINLISYNPKANKFIIACDTKLYTWVEGNEPILLYTGVANQKIATFFINDKQYFLDGTNYLVYDGTNVVDVSTVAYVPTLYVSKAPTGGGTLYEQFNLLTPKFKDSFSGNGSATAYTLSLTNLDAATVIAWVGGVQKTENTDFTVNRTTGVVTFNTAPASGTNNVIIQAEKTQTGFANRIKNCTMCVLYGGQNDTRVFVSGNSNYKNYDWRSGLYDPTYFPELGYEKFGSDATAIKGYAKQYNSLLIFKEDSDVDSTVYIRSFELNSGVATFPVIQGNAKVGCFATGSMQIIDDSPVFFSKGRGVYRFSGGNVKEEKSMQHISDLLDNKLLKESNLDKCISFDFEGKYGLSVNNKVYVMDYRNKYVDIDGVVKYECYTWDSIPANCFFEYNNYLYFGDNTKGMIYKFNKSTDQNTYWNDGVAFTSEWRSKILNFNADNYTKIIEKVFFTIKPTASINSADLYVITNKQASELLLQAKALADNTIVTFDFGNLDFESFQFQISAFPQTFTKKIKAKKVIYAQTIFKNEAGGEGMSISNITIKFDYQNEIK